MTKINYQLCKHLLGGYIKNRIDEYLRGVTYTYIKYAGLQISQRHPCPVAMW